MTPIYQDFESTGVGQVPAGYSGTAYSIVTNRPVSGSQTLGGTSMASGAETLFAGMTAVADVAVQWSHAYQTGAQAAGMFVRASADGQNAYLCFFNFNDPIYIFKRVAGTFAQITTVPATALATSPGDVLITKFEAVGTTLRYRQWLQGSAEPATWDVSITDSSVTAAGYVGFYSNAGSVAIDDVYIGDPGTAFAPPAPPLTVDFSASASGFSYSGAWGAEGSERHTVTSGTPCEFAVAGASSIALLFDASACVKFPAVAYWVDGVGPRRATLDSTGEVPLTLPGAPYDAVAYSTHRVRFIPIVESEYPSAHDNWSDRRDAPRFRGISAPGGTMLAAPGLGDALEVDGDSIVAGLRMLYTSADGVAVAAPELGWVELASSRLGLTPIPFGHGGRGITAAATDGTPAAQAAFGLAYAGKSYAPARPPAVVVLALGTNDSSFTQSQYLAYLQAKRAERPGVPIFALVMPGCSRHASAISGAVAALPGGNAFVLDYAALSVATADGIHPSIGGAATLGTRLAADVRSRLDTLGVRLQPAGSGTIKSGPRRRGR